MPQLESFAEILLQQMLRRGIDGPTQLSRLVKEHYRVRPPREIAAAAGELSPQTLHSWIRQDGRARGLPQDFADVLRIAGALHLPRATTERLLLAAGKPSIARLIAASHLDEGEPTFGQRVHRHLLAPWMAPPPAHLPVPATDLIGRAVEVLDLAERLIASLGDGGGRLVTLTGPGGSGKTRLALEAARLLVDAFPDGVYWIALETLDDPAEVIPAALRAHGITPIAAGAVDQLTRALGQRRVLLVFDKVEHVAGAAPDLAAILTRTEQVRVLLTSRVGLQIGGAHHWPVAPLALPGDDRSLKALRENPSVALFTARATTAVPTFRLTRGNMAAVAALCARLGGMPLAIELAATRVAGRPAAELLEGFSGAPDQGMGGAPGDTSCRDALRRTVSWSYRLLGEDQRRLFRALGCCAGGCAADLAAALYGTDPPPGEIAGLLGDLCDAGLLTPARGPAGMPRFAMLAPIREFAAEQLAGDEEAAARSRHLAWCLDLVGGLAPQADWGAERRAWLDRLDAEYGNICGALSWAEDHDPPRGLELAGRAWPFWLARGRRADGQRRLETLLGRGLDAGRARARALYGLGHLQLWHDRRAAARHLRAALILARAGADRELTAAILAALLSAALAGDDHAALGEYLEAAEALLHEADFPWLAATLVAVRGYAAERRSALREGIELLDRSYGMAREARAAPLCCAILVRLGVVRLRFDLAEEAARAFRELEAIAGEIGATEYVAMARYRSGMVAELRGDLAAARAIYEESLEASRLHGDRQLIVLSLYRLGRVLLRLGVTDRAQTLLQSAMAEDESLLGDRLHAEIRRYLWIALWKQGHRSAAAGVLHDCIRRYRDSDDRALVAEVAEQIAIIAIEAGAPERGFTWLCAVDRLRGALELPRAPVDRAAYRRAYDTAYLALGRSAPAARQRSLGYTTEGLVAEAVGWVDARVAPQAAD